MVSVQPRDEDVSSIRSLPLGALPTLYVARGIVALVWAAAFATVSGSLSAAAVTLLVGYPLIDVVASAVDLRLNRAHRVRSAQAVNLAGSLVAAVAIGIAATDDVAAVLRVFGAWAIVSGALQVVVAAKRRRALGRQSAMLVSGSLSIVAGVVLTAAAAADQPKLANLAGYAAVGGILFITGATLLVRRGSAGSRRRSGGGDGAAPAGTAH